MPSDKVVGATLMGGDDDLNRTVEPSTEGTPEPDGQPGSSAEKIKIGDKEYDAAEAAKVLEDVEGFKKGFQASYTKKRMAETDEVKNLKQQLEQSSSIASDAKKLEEHLKAKNPELYKQFAQVMQEVRQGATSVQVAQEARQAGRKDLPPEVWDLVLDHEVSKFEKTVGRSLTSEEKEQVFARQVELEDKYGAELPFDLVAKATLFGSSTGAAAGTPPPPKTKPNIQPMLRGGAPGVGGGGGKQRTMDDARREALDLLTRG